MIKFLLYALICVILSICFVFVKLTFHAPDHLHAYAAALTALAGLLIVVLKLLPLIHKSEGGSEDLNEIDDGGE
jgi:peptidoglycan biosynthesis protein MviN/MurJ (putative lipid II flippase)